MKKTILSIALAAGIIGAAFVPSSGDRPPAKPSAEINPIWTEFKWPFLLDQWGVGRAFVCKPTECGVAANVYLRPKIGFCKCATGVDDDDELDRVSDISLLNTETTVLGPGHAIQVAWMNGRSRHYRVIGSTKDQIVSIAFNDGCDVVVAVATLQSQNEDAIDRAVIAFLNSDQVVRWVKWVIS